MKAIYSGVSLILLLSHVCLWTNNDSEEKTKKELSEENVPQYAPRGLLIFLNESDTAFTGAVASAFFAALEQQAAPILVSAHFFTLFLDKSADLDKKILDNAPEIQNPLAEIVLRTKQTLQQSQNIVLNKLISDLYQSFLKEGLIHRLAQQQTQPRFGDELWDAVLMNRSFKREDWLIYDVDGSHSLYLLIPVSYITLEINPDFDATLQGVFENDNKDLGFELGFSLATMHMLPDKNYVEYIRKTRRNAAPGHFVNALNKIFLSRQDYFKNKKSSQIPSWTLYLQGHGSPRQTVAEIPLQDFTRMLNFFENSLNTKLFVYNSCYAAGGNSQKIYQDLKQVGSYRIYSYPIVNAALSDEVTSTKVTYFENVFKALPVNWQSKQLYVRHDQQFGEFIEESFFSGPMDFEAVISPILPLIGDDVTRVKTAAQIRLPGMPWFSVIDAQNRVVSLGSIFAATYGKKALNVKQFYNTRRELAPAERKKRLQTKSGIIVQEGASEFHRGIKASDEPMAILLYTTDVPFELDMGNIQSIPHIISLVPGRAVHYITAINAPNISLQKLAGKFENTLAVYKVFLIDTLKVSSLGISSGPAVLPGMENGFDARNVLMKDGEVYFEFNNQVRVLNGKDFAEFEVPPLIKQHEYKQMVEVYRKEISGRQTKQQVGGIVSATPQEIAKTVEKLRELQVKHKERAEQRIKQIEAREKQLATVPDDLAALASELMNLNLSLR